MKKQNTIINVRCLRQQTNSYGRPVYSEWGVRNGVLLKPIRIDLNSPEAPNEKNKSKTTKHEITVQSISIFMFSQGWL